LKRSTSQDFKSRQIIETVPSGSSGPANSTPAPPLLNSNKRRLSEHFQTSLKKFLDKKQQPDKMDTSVQSLLKSFRKDKLTESIQSNVINSNRFKSNCSILNESLNEQQGTIRLDDSQIEIKLGSYNASQLNISTDSYLIEKHKLNQSTILKMESLLNEETKKRNEFEFCYCDSAQSFNSLNESKHQEKIEGMLSSKSSVDSEEGYYSNHDSSSTVSTLVNEPTPQSTRLEHYEDLIYSEPPATPQQGSRRLSIYSQITDRSMFDCNLNLPMDYSRFSYNCYSSSNTQQSCTNTSFNSPQPDVLKDDIYLGSDFGIEKSSDDLKSKLKRYKFCSLSSLKQELGVKQFLNKSNSYVSEIKLFFDKNNNSRGGVNNDSSSSSSSSSSSNNSFTNQMNSSNCFEIQNELKNTCSPESNAFKINIKDLISKFEKNK